jgi:hypothetical protein
MTVSATPAEWQFSLVEWERSPWRGEKYLGAMLNPPQLFTSSLRPTFFHIAQHVVELPEVTRYFK